MDPALEPLNPEQEQAVEHLEGPLLVLAPVGTGKTLVLARRAARAVEAGVNPAHVLCLSFTNRAAREAYDRVCRVVGRAASEMTVRTIHGFCAHILRFEHRLLDLPADFTICDEEDSRALLAEALAEQKVSLNPTDKVAGYLFGFVEDAKLARLPEDDGEVQAFFARKLLRHGVPVPPPIVHCDAGAMLRAYNRLLREQGQVDFHDLIAGVRTLFAESSQALERWRHQFRWVQIDEVQDTSEAEYEILARLCAEHRNLAFFGDIDQTIYEWRGSVPFRMLGRFLRSFAPVRQVELVRNYRSTRAILGAAAAFIRTCAGSVTKELRSAADLADTQPSPGKPDPADGDPVLLREFDTPHDEAAWVCSCIGRLRARHGLAHRDVAVLTRTNAQAILVSEVMTARGVPHFVVDQFKFFRRAEVKDALAHVRFLLNPHDSPSLLRLLQRPPRGIGEATLAKIRGIPRDLGLRLVDFADARALHDRDPYARLLDRLQEGRVVVFDTETTGLDPARDDIIQLAAVRVGPEGILDRFHAYLRTGRPLGDSTRVHGITEFHLDRLGEPPADVLAAFAAFRKDAVLVGHNVGFDTAILAAQSSRLGLPCADLDTYDTLDMTRRLIPLRRYTLQAVCADLGLQARPTHKADDDVAATAELLAMLAARLAATRFPREGLVGQLGGPFVPLAEQVAAWRAGMRSERPGPFLQRLLVESGVEAFTREQPDGERRLEYLRDLGSLFARYDDPVLSPAEALRSVAAVAALGNEMDRYLQAEDRVFVLTVHQAKGLEFDTVFLAGATDEDFPSWHSQQQDDRVAEEHRLFYVAMTRPRRRLIITHTRQDSRGRSRAVSRFVQLIPPEFLRQLGPPARQP